MQDLIYPPLNTKADYYLCLQLFGDSCKQIFQDLLDTRVMWIQTGILSSASEGTTDSTHKIITVPQTGSTPIIYQYELTENSEAKIFKLGFTVSEVSAIINS